MAFKLMQIGELIPHKGDTRVVVHEEYRPGLEGIEQFTHVILLVWLDRNDTTRQRQTLAVHPCGNLDNPMTGVFATRSPARPNPIGHFATRILGRRQDGLLVETVDVFERTPVLDIKPYIPVSDSLAGATVPWWVGRR